MGAMLCVTYLNSSWHLLNPRIKIYIILVFLETTERSNCSSWLNSYSKSFKQQRSHATIPIISLMHILLTAPTWVDLIQLEYCGYPSHSWSAWVSTCKPRCQHLVLADQVGPVTCSFLVASITQGFYCFRVGILTRSKCAVALISLVREIGQIHLKYHS